MKLSLNNKKELLSKILDLKNPFNESESNDIIRFLNKIWDLKSMPSTDDRFQNAEGDIIKHIIANDDWDLKFLFEDRLELYENDEIFKNFLETVVKPEFRTSEDEILYLVLELNETLEKEKFQFNLTEYDEKGLPIYTITDFVENESFPIDIKKNKIPFFVIKNPDERNNNYFSHPPTKELPSFVIVYNDGWNDYGMWNDYYIYYFDLSGKRHDLTELKIISKDVDSIKLIPEKFYQLDDRFCSLGQEMEYYEDLKRLLQNDFLGALYALRDAAFFPEIQEEFENLTQFTNSLIRYDEPERVLREAKHLINRPNLENLYSFNYNFKPKFANDGIDVSFKFSDFENLPDRVFAIIGKNGTGKTQLITSLPIHISEKKKEFFEPEIPLFSKVIAVSYSIFDTFQIPKKTATFNYIYCGLRHENGDLLSEKGLLLRFHNTWKKIQKKERLQEWKSVLMNFIDENLVDKFIIQKNNILEVSIEGFNESRKQLSSGQSIILYTISQIVANIRYDSLLLFDEPETHLHPNAITQLMNTIYSLVEKFESYCILATHSPLIIRECLSRNVLVIERHENISSVRKIGMESFGENLSVLTEEVFGNKETPKQYKRIIDKLILEGYNYQEIISAIESDQIPLSLNAKVYIKSKLIGENA